MCRGQIKCSCEKNRQEWVIWGCVAVLRPASTSMEKDAVSSRREPVKAHTASLKINLLLKGGIPAILHIKVRLQVFRSTVPYLEKVEGPP